MDIYVYTYKEYKRYETQFRGGYWKQNFRSSFFLIQILALNSPADKPILK